MVHKNLDTTQVVTDSDADFDLAMECGASLKWGYRVGPDGEKLNTLAVSMSGADFTTFVGRVRSSMTVQAVQVLHPVFQDIVDKFLRPKLTTGQRSYAWSAGLFPPIMCELEYEAAEEGSREQGTGLQLEPDHPAQMTLLTAELNGVDIYSMLSEEQIAEVQTLALTAELAGA